MCTRQRSEIRRFLKLAFHVEKVAQLGAHKSDHDQAHCDCRVDQDRTSDTSSARQGDCSAIGCGIHSVGLLMMS
ncbi:hypothetical protein D9M72_261040 [compost metagenome]